MNFFLHDNCYCFCACVSIIRKVFLGGFLSPMLPPPPACSTPFQSLEGQCIFCQGSFLQTRFPDIKTPESRLSPLPLSFSTNFYSTGITARTCKILFAAGAFVPRRALLSIYDIKCWSASVGSSVLFLQPLAAFPLLNLCHLISIYYVRQSCYALLVLKVCIKDFLTAFDLVIVLRLKNPHFDSPV